MKLKYSLILVIQFVATFLVAQNIGDAVRYSSFGPMGTARTVGAGSAFGALGGDFSAISINPAGLGDYWTSEFTISPSISSAKTNGFFVADADANLNRSRSGFGLDNIGFVNHSSPRSANWVNSNFAIGFSKLADFGRNISLEGAFEGTITDRFVELANGRDPNDLDPFEAGPAFDAGAIFNDVDGNYLTDYRAGDVVSKSQIIDQRGSLNELSVTYAANYKNKMNIGIHVAIPFINFEETKTYSEGVSVPDENFSNNLDYIENLTTSGAGFNLKLGMQYKASKALRLGAAIHSPTWFTLTDDFNTALNYSFNSANGSFDGSGQSPDGSFRYKLTTPWKAIGSIATVLNFSNEVKGFISADFEFLDYTNNEFDFTAYSNDPLEAQFTQEVNQQIDNRLGSATNIRLGGELAWNHLRLRTGYNWATSPFVADDQNFSSWSAGIGFREDTFYLDFGYRRYMSQEGYNPYVVLDQINSDPLANIESELSRMVVTAGFMF